MALGRVRTAVLTDIANAVRRQAGVATTWRPSQLAAAVAALDGTDAGGCVERPYMELAEGVVSSAVFDDVADAIRGQNGSSDQYAPEEMAAAILALTWDTGLKARALLLDDGTLELNWRDGRSSDLGTISQCWEVDTGGYSSELARPWHAVRQQVRRVVFDADFAGAGMTDFAYFFHSMQQMVEVVGFEQLSGATCLEYAFVACTRLETIWATSFDGSALASATYALNGCRRLVGQTGYVAPDSAGAAAFSFGAAGVLTNPSQDQRRWVYGHLYDTGELEVTASATPDVGRTLDASGRVCVNAHYRSAMAAPWYDGRVSVTSCAFLADLTSVTLESMDYWFYSLVSLASVTGWGNVRGLASMRYALAGCQGLATLDLTGLDPSSLADLFYAFASCGSLVTVWADATWALPAGCTGYGTFYGCRSIVGGNGTAYDGNATSCAMMRIDAVGQAGYLTAS